MSILTPNSPSKPKWLIPAYLIVGVGLWQLLKPVVFPSPIEVLAALPKLWLDGIGSEVLVSMRVNVEALLLSAGIGLPISYLFRVPIARPVGSGLTYFRFAGSAVFFLPLMVIFGGGHLVKVGLIMLAQLFYLVTSMNTVVAGIPLERFDDARTLRMSEWKSVWYVVIRGTIPEVLDAVKANAAIGWSMLMFVEGVVRSEGGVGVELFNAEKHVNYDEFFGIVLIIVLVGIGQDWLLTQIRKAACPYA